MGEACSQPRAAQMVSTSSSGSALHDGFPTCDFSYEDSHVPTTGASRRGANLEVVSSCWCVYWDTGNVDGNDVEIYNYQCDFVVDGGSDVGITTTGHAPSDYNALLNALQSAFCGGSDCYSDDGTSADGVVSVSLSFSGADNPGDLVGFTASIDPIDSASSITWTGPLMIKRRSDYHVRILLRHARHDGLWDSSLWRRRDERRRGNLQ